MSSTANRSHSATDMLAFALPDIGEPECAAVAECLRNGWLTAGPNVKAFEAHFAEAIGARYAIAFNSATTASLLLLEALGIGPGHDVAVPTWTFSGPAMMAHKLGARVLLTDIDDDFNMDVADLEHRATPELAAIMPTHFAGRNCDVDALLAFDRARCVVIDDAAHALPCRDTSGRMVGAQGTRATFFSFYATKTLTTGEGGMVVTDDAALADSLRSRRCHGISRDVHDRYANPATGWQYEVTGEGWKANMTDIAAAIGLGQLARLHDMQRQRHSIALRYHLAFRKLVEDGHLILPALPVLQAVNSWHLYPLRLIGRSRDRFIEAMAEQGVQCSVHFIPLHRHSFWQQNARNGRQDFPNADRLFAQEVSLPIYSKMTDSDVNRVIDAVGRSLLAC